LLNIVDKNVILSSTDIKGNIISVSQAFCEISGYSKEELIGKPHNIVRHSDMKSFVYEDLWETIQSGLTWRGEVKNRRKDGSAYWVYANIEPHYNKQGEIVGYDALRHDITAKKELEEQQAIIVEQSKSAAMGEMISMIAHQWRQPLQAVSILIQKLPLTKMVEGELSDEFIDKVVDDVGLQLDYMSKTIDDFRDFFKPEKLKQTIMVSELIHRSQEFLSYMFKVDSIEFSVESIEDVSLNLHINEVVQVLINIIKNARDAMIEKEIKNRKIIVRHYTKENFAIIEIQDNAGGIKNELKTKIFEPYFSTKQSKNGTGLGLYMSKKIIQQYCKGHIEVDNKDDGAVFTIQLPLDETTK
jgi:PAS domain S-box-containing protein